MLYPSINDLLKDVDSRYTLVLLVSKRARQIVDGAEYQQKALEQWT
ncbi:MAG: DNA-directed RNA polymerase subunit omega, partial [Gottschalkiaceae bacterium]